MDPNFGVQFFKTKNSLNFNKSAQQHLIKFVTNYYT